MPPIPRGPETGKRPKMRCLTQGWKPRVCGKRGVCGEKCGVREIQACGGKNILFFTLFLFFKFPDASVEGFANLFEVLVVFLGKILALRPECTTI
jgi:hypothetical protein